MCIYHIYICVSSVNWIYMCSGLDMDPETISMLKKSKELQNAQAHIWSHTFGFLNGMTLKCAIQLEIPDAIQKHGKPMTLTELANVLAIHPTKASSLYRLMRLLTHSNFFSRKKLPNGEAEFDLTIISQLLLMNHPLTQAPLVLGILDPHLIDPSHHLASWFKNDEESPFHIAHGRSVWEHASQVTKFNECLNQIMASDTRFVGSLLMANDESKRVFEGLESLVDVGGGDGTLAKAIVKACPGLKCIVLDLPHVIKGLGENENHIVPNLVYVGGDMFETIPFANAVLLKWILHDWSDEDCIKILDRCKEAIPSKDLGGKVIIIDTVIGNSYHVAEHPSIQLLLDMEMMSISIGGKERTEDEWKKIFNIAGFNDYKMISTVGLRSIIEVYPS